MTTLVLIGLDCRFTRGVIAALAVHAIRPALLVLPGPPASPLTEVLPTGQPSGRALLLTPSMATGITASRPMHELADTTVRVGNLRDPEVVARVAALQPTAIAVACYLQRVPRALTSLASLSVNVHPSLLPRHRGPDPLFWTFHAGDTTSGVTIHDLAPGFDQGGVFAQECVLLPLDADEHALEADLAQRGGTLLASLLGNGHRAADPQDETQATYESWPTADDLRIPTDWTIERAWRCLHGLAARNLHFHADMDGRQRRINRALQAVPDADGAPAINSVDTRALRLADGWLVVQVRPE